MIMSYVLQWKRQQRILLMQQQLRGQANDGPEELTRFLQEQTIDGDDLDSDDDIGKKSETANWSMQLRIILAFR